MVQKLWIWLLQEIKFLENIYNLVSLDKFVHANATES